CHTDTAVRGDRPGPDHTARADHDDAATAPAAAGVGDRARVVSRAGAATRPGCQPYSGRGEGRATEPAHRQVRVPGVATHTTRAAVRPAATTGVLVVAGRMGIGSAAARRPGRAARGAAIRVAIDEVVSRGAGERVVDVLRRSGDALAFLTMERAGAEVYIIGPAAAGSARQLPAEPGAKALLAYAHRHAIQVERAVHVEHEHPAGRPIEGRGREASGKRGGHILRHPDDLEIALALRQRGSGLGIGVDQPAADRQHTSQQRYGASRHRILVEYGAVERGRAGGRVARDAIAVG